MNYDSVLKNVAKHITLTEEESNRFTSRLTLRSLKRKDFLLKEGQVCKTINFVHEGALRAYYSDQDGKESTIMFALPDWWITDMYCFANARPAMLNIHAIKESNIYELKKTDLDQLYMEVPKFEKFFRIIFQNAYIREQLRVIQNLSLSAEERYDGFVEKYPLVAQLVTQKQIASYLGVSPEFLSVIRKNRSSRSVS